MKLFGYVVAATLLGGFIFAAPAAAQQNPNERDDSRSTIISSPANGATVGRVFTLTGMTAPGCPVAVTFDGGLSYVPKDARGKDYTAGTDGPLAGEADANGRFSLQLDLNGNQVGLDRGNQFRPISAGRHKVAVEPALCDTKGYTGGSVTLTIQATNESAASTPALRSPSPSASPSIAPVMATAPAEEKRDIPFWAWILGGVVVGGSAVAGAEWTAHRYRLKHGGKK